MLVLSSPHKRPQRAHGSRCGTGSAAAKAMAMGDAGLSVPAPQRDTSLSHDGIWPSQKGPVRPTPLCNSANLHPDLRFVLQVQFGQGSIASPKADAQLLSQGPATAPALGPSPLSVVFGSPSSPGSVCAAALLSHSTPHLPRQLDVTGPQALLSTGAAVSTASAAAFPSGGDHSAARLPTPVLTGPGPTPDADLQDSNTVLILRTKSNSSPDLNPRSQSNPPSMKLNASPERSCRAESDLTASSPQPPAEQAAGGPLYSQVKPLGPGAARNYSASDLSTRVMSSDPLYCTACGAAFQGWDGIWRPQSDPGPNSNPTVSQTSNTSTNPSHNTMHPGATVNTTQPAQSEPYRKPQLNRQLFAEPKPNADLVSSNSTSHLQPVPAPAQKPNSRPSASPPSALQPQPMYTKGLRPVPALGVTPIPSSHGPDTLSLTPDLMSPPAALPSSAAVLPVRQTFSDTMGSLEKLVARSPMKGEYRDQLQQLLEGAQGLLPDEAPPPVEAPNKRGAGAKPVGKFKGDAKALERFEKWKAKRKGLLAKRQKMLEEVQTVLKGWLIDVREAPAPTPAPDPQPQPSRWDSAVAVEARGVEGSPQAVARFARIARSLTPPLCHPRRTPSPQPQPERMQCFAADLGPISAGAVEGAAKGRAPAQARVGSALGTKGDAPQLRCSSAPSKAHVQKPYAGPDAATRALSSPRFSAAVTAAVGSPGSASLMDLPSASRLYPLTRAVRLPPRNCHTPPPAVGGGEGGILDLPLGPVLRPDDSPGRAKKRSHSAGVSCARLAAASPGRKLRPGCGPAHTSGIGAPSCDLAAPCPSSLQSREPVGGPDGGARVLPPGSPLFSWVDVRGPREPQKRVSLPSIETSPGGTTDSDMGSGGLLESNLDLSPDSPPAQGLASP